MIQHYRQKNILTMAVTLIYTWDMKKVVAQQIVDVKNSPTTDHGSQVKTDLLDTDMFTVELNKNTKVMKLFHNQNELLSVTHDDRTYVERLFTTLLNTVKQKMRFWSTN
jgi:16S rRNA U516 pseudouridylate synthase RsuA-like enzyme